MSVLITKVDYQWRSPDADVPSTLFIHATGHATEVIAIARRLVEVILAGSGPWRFTSIAGYIPEDSVLDSDMAWKIVAEVKR